MTQLTVRYDGALRTRVVRVTDEPPSALAGAAAAEPSRPAPAAALCVSAAGGMERAAGEFSPTELVAAGLATCVISIIAVAAEKKGIDLAGMSATVTSSMTHASPRRFERIAVDVRIPHVPSDRNRVALERAAHLCPVHRSFSRDVEMPITFCWGSGATG